LGLQKCIGWTLYLTCVFTDVRLRKFAEEKSELLDQVRHLKLELEEERSRHKSDRQRGFSNVSLNGPDTELVDIQSELKSVFSMAFIYFWNLVKDWDSCCLLSLHSSVQYILPLYLNGHTCLPKIDAAQIVKLI
jgi:hypothetical protein